MAIQLLADPSFDLPVSPSGPWVDASIPPASAQRRDATIAPPHTGGFFVCLDTDAANQTARITQIAPALLLPSSNLRLAFFARRFTGPAATVTATVDLTLFGIFPLPGFLAIPIPPGANPPTSSNVYEYYEAFSQPVPFGVTSATVSIAVTSALGAVTWDFDDVTLYNDVI
ncbi:hypothetical protein [Desulfoscipio gibsoniae]|uniref:Uncharacterized protein n=1 Tax=Desulfoscipio gibsoniae DSM 7213 TaxID=767817 RepID=R4KQA3_9FIRM|nr:hypothetical protein [Desulfoscipio gibsoniae]AGL02760.1 hypothetical protein Desgi_3417 [Desulfoscipio gibsoniae DSM 7213]